MGLGELPPRGFCLEVLSVGPQPWSERPDPAGVASLRLKHVVLPHPKSVPGFLTRRKCYSGLMETLQKPQFDSTGLLLLNS